MGAYSSVNPPIPYLESRRQGGFFYLPAERGLPG
jgi:hypothetical protein